MKNLNFSSFEIVFCDSAEALDWAYSNGLSKNAIVYSSAPAILWNSDQNIKNINEFWQFDKFKDFQSSIKFFSEEIFNSLGHLSDIDYRDALRVAKSTVFYHRILYKAATLSKIHFQAKVLVIKVIDIDGGESLNAYWDKILENNKQVTTINYQLDVKTKSYLNSREIPIFRRLFIGGFETLLYRLFTNFYKIFPINIRNKTFLIANENELIIETATALALRGYHIKKLVPIKEEQSEYNESNFEKICDAVKEVVRFRASEWVDPSLIDCIEKMYFDQLRKRLNSYETWRSSWYKQINGIQDSILLINSPGTAKGLSLTCVCNKKNIPIISFQHGITKEICSSHSELSVGYEINSSDCFVAYNVNSAKAAKKSYFSIGKTFISGISARHLRMKKFKIKKKISHPIVYVSTHLYKGNIGAFNTFMTDLDKAEWEADLLTKVFRELPHKVRYKPYPEENIRYPDTDPVLKYAINNIEIYDKKVDMRFLMGQHQVFVTSEATSTLAWLVLSGLPVVFINSNREAPLTKSAFDSLKKGLFLFDDLEENFHENLRAFLSQPIQDIQELWLNKKSYRKEMIEKFISSYSYGAGTRTAKMILREYL